jgi:uncharacterized protein YerC
VFVKAIADLRKTKDVEFFIADLLTPTEKIMIAKRLSIAILVAKGYDYRSISDILKVSSATIQSVNKQIMIDGRGYKKVVAKILKDDELSKFFLDLEESVAKLLAGHPAGKGRVEAAYAKKWRKFL